MKAIIIGATGTIGKAVVDLFSQKGHEVVRASRKSPTSVDMTSISSLEKFYQGQQEADAIITTGGDAAFVGLEQLTEEQIQLTLNSKLMGQINAVRLGLQKLRPNGVFVITGGMLAYSPWPKTAMITMVNSGLEGFAKAATLDMTEGRRVVIVHPPWVEETARALGMDTAPWPNAARVAEAYLSAAEGGKNDVAQFVKGYEPYR